MRVAGGLLAITVAYSASAMLPVGAGAPDIPLTVLGGVLIAAAVGLVAPRMHAGRGMQFAVWFGLLFLNLAAVAVEGTLFAPAAAPASSLAANLLRLLVASAAVAGVAAAVFAQDGKARVVLPTAWMGRVLASAGVYLVLYLVLGGLNYVLFTGPYYEAHAAGLTVPAAQTVLLYEPFRGLLIALSVLPLTLSLRRGTGITAVVSGLLLFAVGGLVPLLPQTSLPLFLRVASLWEIFGQNFFTGVACAYLFMGGHVRLTLQGNP